MKAAGQKSVPRAQQGVRAGREAAPGDGTG